MILSGTCLDIAVWNACCRAVMWASMWLVDGRSESLGFSGRAAANSWQNDGQSVLDQFRFICLCNLGRSSILVMMEE